MQTSYDVRSALSEAAFIVVTTFILAVDMVSFTVARFSACAPSIKQPGKLRRDTPTLIIASIKALVAVRELHSDERRSRAAAAPFDFAVHDAHLRSFSTL